MNLSVFKRMFLSTAFLAVLLGCPAFSAEPREPDIWTEDTEQMREGPWSERRIEGFLSRLERDDPERARTLRKLQQENPDEFQRVFREEVQKFLRLPEPPVGQRGPKGPGDQPPGPDSGRPRRGPDEGRGGRWLDHLQKRHDEFIQWLEKNNPALAGELERLRETDEGAYYGRVMEARRQYDPILRAEKDNPELAEVLKEDLVLQRQREELIEGIRSAEGQAKERLLKRLEVLVSRRFDLIIRKKTLQYQELEERLRRLQKEIEKRQAEVSKLQTSKEQAVRERMQELTAQAERIYWD